MPEQPEYLSFQADLNDPDVVSAYDELPLWSALAGSLLLKHVPLQRHLQVLDVGCGTGFPALELAQRLGSTCTVYGIDPWEAALQRAQLKMRLWNVSNVRLSLQSAEAMSFPDGQFDLIISNLGINNFSHPEAALRECWRVAKPTAKLALTTNLQGHMVEFYEVYATTLQELDLSQAVAALDAHIHHRATVEGLRQLLELTGFAIIKVQEETATMRFADGSALLNHYFIKLAFLDSWKGILNPAEQAAVLTRLETNLNLYAEWHGELALTIPLAYVEAEKVG